MNWLAHLRLAPADPLLRIGNLCGDFVRGADVASLHPTLRHGIAQHRAIDRFVDAHEVVRRSRARVGPPFRRFAGVLVDVYHDHFLARAWDRLGDGRSLAAFAAGVHDELAFHRDLLPPRLRAALPAMRSQRWLVAYAELEGIGHVLGRMAQRLRRPSPLGRGGEPLRAAYGDLERDFTALWPDLERFAACLPRDAAL